MGQLDIPWDIAVLPTGAFLVTERDRQRITLHTSQGGRRVVSNGPPGIWSGGETGLMSILRDPTGRPRTTASTPATGGATAVATATSG